MFSFYFKFFSIDIYRIRIHTPRVTLKRISSGWRVVSFPSRRLYSSRVWPQWNSNRRKDKGLPASPTNMFPSQPLPVRHTGNNILRPFLSPVLEPHYPRYFLLFLLVSIQILAINQNIPRIPCSKHIFHAGIKGRPWWIPSPG